MNYLKKTTRAERGILTSTYKQEVKKDTKRKKVKSISRIKSLILNHQGKTKSQIGVILQISVFVIAIAVISL